MSDAMGLPSWEPVVRDRERVPAEILACLGVETSFCGESGNGGGAPRILIGEEEPAVVAAFCRVGGPRGMSKKPPG